MRIQQRLIPALVNNDHVGVLTVTHLEFTLALALESLALDIFAPLSDGVDGTKLGEPFF